MAKRRRRSKKWLSRITLAVLLVIAIVVCYFVWNAYFRDKKEEQPAAVEPDRIVNMVDLNTPIEKRDNQPQTDDKEKGKPTQYEGENPNEVNGVTGVITYAGISGDYLMVRVNIDQYLNGGICTIGLKKDGDNVYSAGAPIVDAASTSTCEGFNVPLDGLQSGRLEIVIDIKSDNKTGKITGEVTL